MRKISELYDHIKEEIEDAEEYICDALSPSICLVRQAVGWRGSEAELSPLQPVPDCLGSVGAYTDLFNINWR